MFVGPDGPDNIQDPRPDIYSKLLKKYIIFRGQFLAGDFVKICNLRRRFQFKNNILVLAHHHISLTVLQSEILNGDKEWIAS